MFNKFLKIFQRAFIFWAVIALVFSNVSFNVLTGAIDAYIKASNIVDNSWRLSQDSNIVDKFTSYRHLAEKVKIYEAYAASLEYVGGAEASGNSAAYNVALTSLTGGSGGAVQSGDLVIVATGFVQTSNLDPGVSTAGYNEVADLYQNDTRDANFSVNWKYMSGAPDTAVNCLGSGSATNGAVCVVHVWRNADPTNPLDVVSTTAQSNNSSIPNSPAITPITSGAVVISAGLGTGAAVDTSITAPSGYGNQVDISVDPSNAATVGISSKAWSGSGAEDPAAWTNWTTTTSDSWAAVTLAIRPEPAPAITTISNFVSAEPGNSTIAPAAAGNLDSFGLATDTGTDTVTAATVGLAAGMGQYIQTVAITNDGDTVTYCSAAPSGDSASLSSCGIPVSTTNTQFKIKLTAIAHTSMPAPDGGAYAVTATVTGFTSTNGQAGTDSGSSTLTIDNDSPAGTTGAGATSGENTQSVVSWTPPGDGDFQQVYIYCKTSSLLSGEAPTEGTDPVVDGAACDGTARMKYKGTSSPQTITGLTNGTTYYFRIYARDTNGNFTAYSATQQVTGTPSAVATLTISASAGSKVANVDSGATSQFVHNISCATDGTCAAFKLAASGGAISVTQIKVTEFGTVDAFNNLASPALLYDTDANYANGTAGTFGSATNFAADQTITFTNAGLSIPNGSTYYFYIIFNLVNVANYPVGGNGIDFKINASSDVVSDGTENGTATLVSAASACSVTSETCVRPQITGYTNSETGLNYVASCTGCGARLGGGDGFRQTITISGYGFGADPGLGLRDTATNKVEVVGAVTTIFTDDASVNTNVSAWSNTSITIRTDTTITGNADGDWGTNFGGANALKITAGGQAVGTNLNFYLFPQVTGIRPCDKSEFPVGNNAREYNASDSACPNGLTDGEIFVDGTRFGTVQTGGWVRILGCDNTTCSSPTGSATITSWGNTAIAVQVPNIAAIHALYTGSLMMQQGAGSSNKTHTYTTTGFRILPRITSNTQNNGVVGDIIKITGDHFCQGAGCPTAYSRSSTANNVKFDTTQAIDVSAGNTDFINIGGAPCSGNAQAWTDSEICVKVPAGISTGSRPTQITSSTSYISNAQAFTVNSSAPNNPNVSGSRQYKSDNATIISASGTTNESTVILKADISASISINMALQVEIKPTGTTFTCGAGDCAAAVEGTVVDGGACTSCTSLTNAKIVISSLSEGQKHWQARVRNTTTNEYSGWISFGTDPDSVFEIDFIVDTTAPSINPLTADNITTNAARITWETTGDFSSTQLAYGTDATLVTGTATTTETDISPTVISHAVNLSNLSCGIQYYYYRARSRDNAGNVAFSAIQNFQTNACPQQPAKTAVFHIVGATGSITGATAYPFSVTMPELATSTQSAFVELTGVYETSAGSITISVQHNSEPARTYTLPGTASGTIRSSFKIIHKVASVNYPASNTLTVTPASATMYISSAKITVTYAYTP